jgi:uncharacterized protein
MPVIGRYNTLKVRRLAAKGAYLYDDLNDDADNNENNSREILLPARFVPRGTRIDSELTVFVYLNSDGLLTATTVKPLAQVGEFAYLKTISVNDTGAFLAWGLPKDLLLPYGEMPQNLKTQLEPGNSLLVRVFLDEHERIAASARLADFLDNEASTYRDGDAVEIIVDGPTDLGQRVIVEHRYWGLIHNNEIFRPLHRGEKLQGYIKTVRSDGKLNIALQAPGPAKIDSIAQGILDILAKHNGFMAISDKSPPEQIYQLFGVSKKVFKQAIGRLYKDRFILIEKDGLRRTDKT